MTYYDDSELLEEVRQLEAENAQLRAALEGLGVHPEYGYCFCLTQEQQAMGHTGECKEARVALADTAASPAEGGEEE